MASHPFVVVIDDDRSVRRALGRLLRTSKMDVETYASAEQFLRATLPREPDCLILDVRMPGMTGPALRDLLRASGRQIPIVFITAHEDATAGVAPASGPASDVLLKPFDDRALLAAIARAMA